MKNKNNFSHYKYLQLKAIDCIFNSDDLYIQRKICRWYSKEFSTPLIEVEKLSFDYVLMHYYENQFEQIPHNDLIDITIQDHLPALEGEESDKIETWIKSLEEEQEITLKAKEKRQSLNDQAVPVVKNQSTTSDQALQPEDVVMNFRDEDFSNE